MNDMRAGDTRTNGIVGAGCLDVPIIGASDAARRLRETVRREVRSPSAGLLVVGPDGAGKTFFARTLHGATSRRDGPFVPYVCVDAYDPGTALLGARSSRASGLLTATQGGSLLLEGVDRLDDDTQAAVLEWIERTPPEGAPLLIGLATRDADTGPLTAWLARTRVEVPALAERTADIVPLARHFLDKVSRRGCGQCVDLTADAEGTLLAHDWPGNIRQLRTVIERAAARNAGSVIDARHLRIVAPPAWSTSGDVRPLREIENAYIEHVIALTGGNKTRAAQLLGIARETLRVRRHGGRTAQP